MTVDIRTLARLKVIVLLVVLTAFFNAYGDDGRDLGTIGKTYPILEEDMLKLLQEKAKKMDESGELQKLNKKRRAVAQKYIATPPGINLPRTSKYRIYQITPLFTLEYDIKDASGKILYPKGTTVNPLRVMSLSKKVYFIDGSDTGQMKWIDEKVKKDITDKVVLVNGSYVEAVKKLKRRIFFDQRGKLVARLNIQAVPAILSQKREGLYVEEIPID